MYKILKNLVARFNNSSEIKRMEFSTPYVSNTFDHQTIEMDLPDVDCFYISVNNIEILIINDIDEISITESKNKTTITFKDCMVEIVWC